MVEPRLSLTREVSPHAVSGNRYSLVEKICRKHQKPKKRRKQRNSPSPYSLTREEKKKFGELYVSEYLLKVGRRHERVPENARDPETGCYMHKDRADYETKDGDIDAKNWMQRYLNKYRWSEHTIKQNFTKKCRPGKRVVAITSFIDHELSSFPIPTLELFPQILSFTPILHLQRLPLKHPHFRRGALFLVLNGFTLELPEDVYLEFFGLSGGEVLRWTVVNCVKLYIGEGLDPPEHVVRAYEAWDRRVERVDAEVEYPMDCVIAVVQPSTRGGLESLPRVRGSWLIKTEPSMRWRKKLAKVLGKPEVKKTCVGKSYLRFGWRRSES